MRLFPDLPLAPVRPSATITLEPGALVGRAVAPRLFCGRTYTDKPNFAFQSSRKSP
jgi:hypothetical protein